MTAKASPKDAALKLALEALERIAYFKLQPDTIQNLTDHYITAIKEALAGAEGERQPEQEPVAIKWTLDGDKTCGYNNWLGETPFGRILITWKGWKDDPIACVDSFPGDFYVYGSPDEVKEMCEAEFGKRLATPPKRTWEKPWVSLTDEEIKEASLKAGMQEHYMGFHSGFIRFARAIEAKLKEKNT